MIRIVAALCCALAILAPPTPAVGAAQFSTIDALLHERSEAVRGCDEQRYLNTLSADADVSFVDRERQRFRGLCGVGFSEYDIRVVTDASGDLAKGLDLKNALQVDVASLPQTEERSRIGGMDSRDAVATYWWTYVKRNGSWSILADTHARQLGLKNAVGVWDAGEIVRIDRNHIVVLAPSALRDRAQTIADIAESAIVVHQQRDGIQWTHRIPILLPADSAMAARIIQTSRDLSHFGALTVYLPDRSQSWDVFAPRIVVQDDVLSHASSDSLRNVFLHELSHAARAERSGPATPHWLDEGIAVSVQRRLSGPYVPTLRTTSLTNAQGRPMIPSDDSFFTSDGKAVADAYDLAASFVQHLRTTCGATAPDDIYEHIGAERMPVGTPDHIVATAIERVCGLPQATVVTRWQSTFPVRH